MKSNYLILIMLTLPLFLKSQKYSGVESITYNHPGIQTTMGIGDISTEMREIESDFSEIIIGDGIQLFPTDEQRKFVTLKGQQNILDLIETKFDGELLIIRMRKPLHTEFGIKVYVSMQNIKKITLKENAFIDFKKEIRLNQLDLVLQSESTGNVLLNIDRLNIHIEGGAKLFLKGQAQSANIRVKENSVLAAKAFSANKVDATILNNALCEIKVKEALHATVRYNATLAYFGKPKEIKQTISNFGQLVGASKIIKI